MDDMKFWKEHTALRMVLMLVTFLAGIFLLIYGWKQAGQLGGAGTDAGGRGPAAGDPGPV